MTLPGSHTLHGKLSIPSPYPIASGAVADIYEGTLDGQEVYVKRAQTYSSNATPLNMVCGPPLPSPATLNGTQKLYKEAIIWRYMSHPNIVPLLGATTTPFQLALKRMPGGNLIEYIKANPDADPLGLVCPSSPP